MYGVSGWLIAESNRKEKWITRIMQSFTGIRGHEGIIRCPSISLMYHGVGRLTCDEVPHLDFTTGSSTDFVPTSSLRSPTPRSSMKLHLFSVGDPPRHTRQVKQIRLRA